MEAILFNQLDRSFCLRLSMFASSSITLHCIQSSTFNEKNVCFNLTFLICHVQSVNAVLLLQPLCCSTGGIMQRLTWRRAAARAGDLWERFCTRQRGDSLPNRWRWLMKARHLSQQCHPPPFLEARLCSEPGQLTQLPPTRAWQETIRLYNH